MSKSAKLFLEEIFGRNLLNSNVIIFFLVRYVSLEDKQEVAVMVCFTDRHDIVVPPHINI